MANSKLTIATMLTVLCIGAYGCSDSDSEPTPSPTTTPQTNPPVNGSPTPQTNPPAVTNFAPSTIGLAPIASGPIAPGTGPIAPVTQDPVPQDPVTADPVPQDPVVTPPAPQDPIAPDPVTQNPPSLNLNLANSELRKLLGTVTFSYGIAGDSNQITHRVNFSEDSFNPAFLNDETLAPEFRAWLLAGSINTITGCVAPPESQSLYLCLLLAFQGDEVSSETDFIFQLSSATTGEGVFEFCTPDVDSCLNNLEVSPDGNVFVSIDNSGIALAQNGTQVNGIRMSQYETESYIQAAKLEFGPATRTSSSTEQHEYAELSQRLKHRLLAMRSSGSAVISQ